MSKRNALWAALLAVPLAAVGVVYGKSLTQRPAEPPPQPTEAKGYVCPINGEELPCPHCCPLNQKN
jgi:hypothetical protein